MKIIRILGIIILVAGLSSYFFADYIATQVSAGREEVASGQQKVDIIEDLSSLSPYTKGAGSMVAGSAQKKIDAGNMDIAKYQQISNLLHQWGIITSIFGALLICISFSKIVGPL